MPPSKKMKGAFVSIAPDDMIKGQETKVAISAGYRSSEKDCHMRTLRLTQHEAECLFNIMLKFLNGDRDKHYTTWVK